MDAIAPINSRFYLRCTALLKMRIRANFAGVNKPLEKKLQSNSRKSNGRKFYSRKCMVHAITRKEFRVIAKADFLL